ncbi:MAG: L,D-transpeptidase [Pseudomonadota bacterium]|nr:L,D-transpeptidase [Pseudomonadota bacterium]
MSCHAVSAQAQGFTPYPASPGDQLLVVSVADQAIRLYRQGFLIKAWPVSTSRFGTGSAEGSLQTPLGVHVVRKKIGKGVPPGTWFVARGNTGRLAPIITDDRPADRDYVTSRILWLKGLEPGKNQGPGVDSWDRLIYIHGTAEEGRIGRPASRGCIRMRNADVIELFDLVEEGTVVDIRE